MNRGNAMLMVRVRAFVVSRSRTELSIRDSAIAEPRAPAFSRRILSLSVGHMAFAQEPMSKADSNFGFVKRASSVASRTRPWLASGSGCRGRRLSRACEILFLIQKV
jgi:hypothetical protein